MHLFLDTNVYLSFYRRSPDDMTKLETLKEHVEDSGIRLLVPQNVIDEFWRNREKVISGELGRLQDQKTTKIQLPRMADGLPLASELQTLTDDRNQRIDDLVGHLLLGASRNRLVADQMIESLFSAALIVPTRPECKRAAEERVALDNPPGKPGKLGDRLNWESLLEQCHRTELHLVSQDGDFASPLDKGQVHEYLRKEWHERCHSELKFYVRLGDFFRANLPDASLAYDQLTEFWIDRLDGSMDVESAAAACSSLDGRDLSYEQAQRLIAIGSADGLGFPAFLGDERVWKFFDRVLTFHGDHETPEYYDLADQLYDNPFP